ncbi:hypothetical protein STRDD11_00399 [Streptococcus sp. DD11]|nr:hypothetical protein STRDD11_00399 [Streptococcus sp. DD11]
MVYFLVFPVLHYTRNKAKNQKAFLSKSKILFVIHPSMLLTLASEE